MEQQGVRDMALHESQFGIRWIASGRLPNTSQSARERQEVACFLKETGQETESGWEEWEVPEGTALALRNRVM
jgi:hypothetical protein